MSARMWVSAGIVRRMCAARTAARARFVSSIVVCGACGDLDVAVCDSCDEHFINNDEGRTPEPNAVVCGYCRREGFLCALAETDECPTSKLRMAMQRHRSR